MFIISTGFYHAYDNVTARLRHVNSGIEEEKWYEKNLAIKFECG